jgi:hypothetical protein
MKKKTAGIAVLPKRLVIQSPGIKERKNVPNKAQLLLTNLLKRKYETKSIPMPKIAEV